MAVSMPHDGQAVTGDSPPPGPASGPARAAHPFRRFALYRVPAGLVTLILASVIVFLATQALPGNAANAAFGIHGTPAQVHALEKSLGLDRSAVDQYFSWLSGMLTGSLHSLTSGSPTVSSIVFPALANTGILVLIAAVCGVLIAGALGILSAVRRDGPVDHVLSSVALTITSLPEFVVAIIITILFATNVLHLEPAVAATPTGSLVLHNPRDVILPAVTLTVLVVPYMYRMLRRTLIESLQSDYVELAELKGQPRWRLVLMHALPTTLPAVAQVIGSNLLYLAGGVVVVEQVYNYPGVGQGLVSAVTARDIPTIQTIVVLLAAFYVLVNIGTDAVTLAVSPRRRVPAGSAR